MNLRNFKLLLLSGIILSTFLSCATQDRTRDRTRNQGVRTTETRTPVKDTITPKSIPAEKEATKTTEPKIETPVRQNNTKVEKKAEETKLIVHLPKLNREFRAAWIASVANINWPSKRGLSVEQQKAEASAILDMLKENNFNAVILQVRPSADALYPSTLEPWSIFLTGENGKEPYPFYDPLEYWISESHLRGIEFHAWLNPYRAHHTNGGSVRSSSMVNKMPNEIVRLKNGMYWFDPAKKSTQDHVSKVVKDLVERYDVDGVHFDDYFYPYASYNGGADFPDNDSWNAYLKSGGKLSRADWRRENVNLFIERIYSEIKAEKNWVKFGISPFGIWKSGVPHGVAGMSQYDELYADAKLWLNKGWIDYFTPQLYWPVDAPRQGFKSLLTWWESENTYKRHLWPGLNTVEIKAADKPAEIIRQIQLTREVVPNSTGVVHYSMAGLNLNMLHSLKTGPYKEKALVPKSPWLKPLVTGKPSLTVTSDSNYVQAKWSCNPSENIMHWVLYVQYGDTWETEILESLVSTKEIKKEKNGKKLNAIAIQSVDRLGNESDYEAKKVS